MRAILSIVGVTLVSVWLARDITPDTPQLAVVANTTPALVAPKLTKPQIYQFDIITSTYDVGDELVRDVIKFSHKYQKKSFPRAEDILAIVGIESSWDPTAKSNLKFDPAFGLTQIRPIAWKKLIPNSSDLISVENQIKYAVEILHLNYRLTKSKDDAIIAYNVGYGNWLNGNFGFDYLLKFKSELSKYRRV